MRTIKNLLVAAVLAFVVAPLSVPVVNSVAPTEFAQSYEQTVVPTATAGAWSDYSENALVDTIFRGQTVSGWPPTSMYVGLATTSASDSACGTEVTGGSYARVAVTGSLANWAATQNTNPTGTTAASSGTGGTTFNSSAITFPTPTANWGTITDVCVWDASTGGNLLWYVALTTSKTVNNGDPAPSFAAGALTFQVDN